MIPITCDNQKLFEFIYNSVIYGDGGDGYAGVKFKHQDYLVVSKEFEEFLKSKGDTWEIEYGLDYCQFRHHYEGFTFYSWSYSLEDMLHNEHIVVTS